MKIEDAAIVGAGPAGIAAAIQLARHGVEPILFEKDRIGGLLRNAYLVENYPGFPGGISGTDLVRRFEEHLRVAPVKVVQEEVTALDREDGSFIVETARSTIRSRAVIVASGTRAREIADLVLPEDAVGMVFNEVYALRDTVNARIVIVGAGDAAFDYALNLAARNAVTILNRGVGPRCLPLLSRRASSSGVTYREKTRLTDVATDPGGGLLLTCDTHGDESRIRADYLVVAIGREPDDGFVSARLRRKAPELEAGGDLNFAGDVRGGIFRQTGIAVGQGVLAAMRVARRLGGGTR